MAIAFGSAGTRLLEGTSSTSWAVPYPAGISAGDLLVLHIITNGGAVTTPAGWTAQYNEAGLTNPKGGLFTKVASGSETGTLAVTTASTTGNAMMFRYTGVDTTTPVDVAASSSADATGSTSDTTIPGITTVTAGAWLVYANGLNSGSTTVTTSNGTGFTERVDHGATGGTGTKGGALYDEPFATAGATGNRVLTLSASRADWGAMIALRPAGAGGGGPAAPDGLHWDFDDGTSGSWTSTTAGAGTTAVTAADAHNGQFGISADVPAATTDKAGFILDYTPAQQVTIRGWWKVTTEGASSSSNVPFARFFNGTQRLADVYRQNQQAPGAANVWLRVVKAIGGSNYYYIPTGYSLPMDTWVYVSVTWGLDGNPSLYIDGVQYLGPADAPADWYAASQIDRSYLGTHEAGNQGAWSMDSVDLLTGVPAIAGEVRNEPLLTSEAFGSPSATIAAPAVSPTGIASAGAVGAPTISALLVTFPSGVATASAFGTTAASTSLTSQPTGIASAQAMGAPAAATTLSASPAGIATGEAFGAQTVTTALTAAPSGVTTAQTFGTPAIGGNLTASPAGIATAQAFGTPSAATTQSVSVTGIGTAEALGAPSVSMPIAASPAGIPTAETFGTPRAAGSTQYSPDGIVTAEAVGAPALAATLAVSPAGIASPAAFGTPSATVQDLNQTAGPAGIASSSAFGSPNVIGNRMVGPTAIASLEAFGTPRQSNVLVTFPEDIPSFGNVFGSPAATTRLDVIAQGIPSASAVGAPTLIKLALLVGPAGIASLEAAGAPTAGGSLAVRAEIEIGGKIRVSRYTGGLGQHGTTSKKPNRWEGTLG